MIRQLSSRWFAALIMLASVIALGVAVWSGIRNSEHAQCQSMVNELMARALSERAKAADADRSALDQLVSDSLSATSDTQIRAALERYRETRAQADRDRAEHPLPQPPSASCG